LHPAERTARSLVPAERRREVITVEKIIDEKANCPLERKSPKKINRNFWCEHHFVSCYWSDSPKEPVLGRVRPIVRFYQRTPAFQNEFDIFIFI
jgi:hypothetical protein